MPVPQSQETEDQKEPADDRGDVLLEGTVEAVLDRDRAVGDAQAQARSATGRRCPT